MARPQSPCLDCIDRILYCHSTCDKYIKYKCEGRKLFDLMNGNSLRVTAKRSRNTNREYNATLTKMECYK